MRYAACLSLFPTCLLAQATLLVGPGQTYTDIPAAIAAAQPGDRVLVHAGTYSPFDLDKGILLRAEPLGASVSVTGSSAQYLNLRVPAGQSALIAGIQFTTALWLQLPPGQTTAGPLSLENVTAAGGILVYDAHLTLRECQVRNYGTGISMQGASTLSAVQSTIAANFQSFFPAVDGITAGGMSHVHLSGCTVTGGTAGFHSLVAAGNGVTLSGGARGWFVDSTLQSYQGPVWPFTPVGLSNQSSVAATVERCVLRDSNGIAPSSTGLVQNGLVVGLSSSTPLARGSTFTLDYHSRPGLPVIAHAAFGLSTPAIYALVAQPDFGFVLNSFPIAFAVADPQGLASVSITLPNSAWLQDLQLWFGGWSEQSLPVQLAPVLGGIIR